MKPVEFENSKDKHGEIPVFTNRRKVVSCWEATFWERLKFLFTGKFYLIISQTEHPETGLETAFPFKKEE